MIADAKSTTPDEKTEPTPLAPVSYRGETQLTVSLFDILIVLAERKRLIFTVIVAFVVVATIASLLIPKSYTATVTLLPPEQNTSMGAALASQLGGLGSMASLAGGGLSLKNPNDKYVALLKSRTVEDAMVQHFDLMREYHDKYLSRARKDFENHATVDGSGKDGLIHLSIEDHDASRSAQLANGYVEQFRELSQNLAITEASQRRLFFERELEQAKNKLADAEEALEKTELSTGVIQPDSQARALIESAATLRAQITAREVQIQGMQTYATGENSQLVQAQQELSSLRAQLEKLGGSGDSSGDGLIVPRGKVPGAGMAYIRKLRDVKYYETIFDILARQFEIAKLDEAKQGSIIQVVDPAIIPDRKSSPKRLLIVIGAALVGAFVGIFIALFQAALGYLSRDSYSSAKVSSLKRALSVRST